MGSLSQALSSLAGMNGNEWGPQPAVAPPMQRQQWGCVLKAFLWSQPG